MLNWKNICKSWVGVPVLILIALMVVLLLPGYKSWQLKRAYDKVEELYYTDNYGGATPEETYDLFIDALKDGDLELASKYFVLGSQDNWLETLDKYQKSSYLPNFIKELENTKNKWSKIEMEDPNAVAFRYQSLIEQDTETKYEGQKLVIPAGNYTNESIFRKYPSGVWKIELL